MEDAIRHAVAVPVPPERAFAAFTDEMVSWWPREYTWAEQSLAEVVMEPRPGGRWYERDAAGGEQDWGDVRAWDPHRRIVLGWGISPTRLPEPDPSHASEIEVRFVPEAGGTRVELEHRAFAAHGAEVADAYRAGMDSPRGWPAILSRFADAIG